MLINSLSVAFNKASNRYDANGMDKGKLTNNRVRQGF